MYRAGISLILTLACATPLESAAPGGARPLEASFKPSGASSSPNLVRLRLGSKTGDRVTLEVALGGPTESRDLYGFAFDLELGDPTVAELVPGSAEAGDALVKTGTQGIHAMASQRGDRVVVGVTKLGPGGGNGVPRKEATVVRLTFRMLRPGSSAVAFVREDGRGQPAGTTAAVDSAGKIVPSIRFDPKPVRISAR